MSVLLSLAVGGVAALDEALGGVWQGSGRDGGVEGDDGVAGLVVRQVGAALEYEVHCVVEAVVVVGEECLQEYSVNSVYGGLRDLI